MSDHTSLNRRQAIVRASSAGAAGLVTLALPGAATAASGAGGSSGPTEFADQLIAAWGGGATDSYFTSSLSQWDATFENETLQPNGVMTLGGTFYSGYSALYAAGTVGIAPSDDPRHWYVFTNQAATFDVGSASVPYLQWTITAGSSAISFAYFFMGFNAYATTASFRSSVDSYASSIRTFAGDNSGDYALVRVDLSAQPVLSPGASRTFRLYLRGDSVATQIFATSNGEGTKGLEGVQDAWQSPMGYNQMGFVHA